MSKFAIELCDLHCSSMKACLRSAVSGRESMTGSRAGVSPSALLDGCSLRKRGRAETEVRSNKHVAIMSHNFILDPVPLREAATV